MRDVELIIRKAICARTTDVWLLGCGAIIDKIEYLIDIDSITDCEPHILICPGPHVSNAESDDSLIVIRSEAGPSFV